MGCEVVNWTENGDPLCVDEASGGAWDCGSTARAADANGQFPDSYTHVLDGQTFYYNTDTGAVVYPSDLNAHQIHLILDKYGGLGIPQPWDMEDLVQKAQTEADYGSGLDQFGSTVGLVARMAAAFNTFGISEGVGALGERLDTTAGGDGRIGGTIGRISGSLGAAAAGINLFASPIAVADAAGATAGDVFGGVGQDTLAGGEAADTLEQAASIGVQAAAQAIPEAAATAGSSGFSLSDLSTVFNVGKTLAGIGLTIAGIGQATSAGKGGTASSMPRPPVQTVTNITQRQIPVAAPSPHYASQYLSTIYSGSGTAGDAGRSPDAGGAETGVSVPPPQGTDLSGTMLLIAALALAWALAQRSLHHV